eukprot:jgi/Hompol1/6915/HPOL_002472-RA
MREWGSEESENSQLAGTVEEEAAELGGEVERQPQTEAVWQIGVGPRSAAVTEEGVVRIVEFTRDLAAPTAEHIAATVAKAVVRPAFMGELQPRRPRFATFAASATSASFVSQTVLAQAARLLADRFAIRVLSPEELAAELPQIAARRKKEAEDLVKKQTAALTPTRNLEIKLNPPPKRICISCRKQIDAKPSQCSVY